MGRVPAGDTAVGQEECKDPRRGHVLLERVDVVQIVDVAKDPHARQPVVQPLLDLGDLILPCRLPSQRCECLRRAERWRFEKFKVQSES